MGLRSREDVNRRADAAQREADHDRWADDGGFIPGPDAVRPEAGIEGRTPWVAFAAGAALGFAVGWLTGRREP